MAKPHFKDKRNKNAAKPASPAEEPSIQASPGNLAPNIVPTGEFQGFTRLGRKHILLIFGMVILVNLFFFPANKHLISHQIQYDPSYQFSKQSILSVLNTKKPDLILLGNSMVGRGIHEAYFNHLSQTPSVILAPGGAASAWWYLAMKNIIPYATPKPKVIALFFRDNYLTYPTFRVSDDFKSRLDVICERDEPLLDKIAYMNRLSDSEYALKQNWPLYQKRDAFVKNIDSHIKKMVAALFATRNPNMPDSAIAHVFADSQMNPEIFTKYIDKYEKNNQQELGDFNVQLSNSFLPEIIRLAKENGIQLVFIRVKRRPYNEPNFVEPKELTAYIAQLTAYFKTQQIPFIDFSYDKRLNLSHYSDGDHMNTDSGLKLFTEISAEALEPILAKELGAKPEKVADRHWK